MFGKDSSFSGSTNHNNEMNNTSADFLRSAEAALKAGDETSALHLFLVAYEKAVRDSKAPSSEAIAGLRKAWDLACKANERSLAEYIFEKLEPFLNADETARFAEQLQRMALSKLEEFGLSHEDVQDMADMLSEDFMGASGSMQLPAASIFAHPMLTARETQKRSSASSKGASARGLKSLDAQGAKSAQGDTQGGVAANAQGAAESSDDSDEDTSFAAVSKRAALRKSDSSESDDATDSDERFRYKDLIGFDATIQKMHTRGIGLADDARFNNFLEMLSRRHGIDSPPSVETLVFNAYAREDANQFMAATVGELNVPIVRMSMEETPQGVPVLCVMASSDFKTRAHLNHLGFDGPAVLMLEDVDTWGSPIAGMDDEIDGNLLAQMSRGAREAVALVRSAVENPQVTVVASCSSDHMLDDFFYELLSPVAMVDIDLPNNDERSAVWNHAAQMYPSLRFLNREELIRLSAHMSRFDIYMAAQESVEQAYRESVERRSYVPVTRDNIFDKIAAYQPLDSGEYKELEDAAVQSFRDEIDHLDSSTKGSAE